jgi:hypothetical protein
MLSSLATNFNIDAFLGLAIVDWANPLYYSYLYIEFSPYLGLSKSMTQPSKKQLLLVCHTPSTNTMHMAEQLLAGARAEAEDICQVSMLTPGQCQTDHLLAADAVVFLTTENLGYMAGSTKDLFDRTFYSLEGRKQGLSYALVVRAGLDGTGCTRAVESICSGLGWQPVQERLLCKGPWQEEFSEQCYQLGQVMMASMAMGII